MQLNNFDLSLSGGVAVVTLNRPERKNAWSVDMEVEFRQALEHLNGNEAAKVIVITGAGSAFCVGADMQRLASVSAGDGASARPAPRPVSDEDFDQRYSWMLTLDKPLIAAINGAVAGVGLCLSLYCDLRYMASSARMSSSFARRGLIAEHGSAWLLPRLIGPMNAADLLLTGRTITASEAAAMGLVVELPADEFLDAVKSKALEMAKYSSPRSMRIIKRQLREVWRQTLAQATQVADLETALCRDSADFKEGVASFKEKRDPQFSGH